MRPVVLTLVLTACGGSHPLGEPPPPPTWPMAEVEARAPADAEGPGEDPVSDRTVLIRFPAGEPPVAVVAGCGDEGQTDEVADRQVALTLPGGVDCTLRTGGDDPVDIDLPADAEVVDCLQDATGWSCVPGLPTGGAAGAPSAEEPEVGADDPDGDAAE